MSEPEIQALRAAVRDVPDFPKAGIMFKDITPILADGSLLRSAVGLFVHALRDVQVDKIVGIDARGFLFASAVACQLGTGLIPVRKRGKLPHRTISESYALEYGVAEMEMHLDAINPGERIVIIDDLLATGGTAAAAAQLVRTAGGLLQGCYFLIELEFLEGRGKLAATNVVSFLRY